jgi:hypothetical protein
MRRKAGRRPAKSMAAMPAAAAHTPTACATPLPIALTMGATGQATASMQLAGGPVVALR